MHRVAAIEFSTAAAAPRLRLEVDGRSRDIPLEASGPGLLADEVAAPFHRAARCSVGLDYFRWWLSLRDALLQEFGSPVKGAVAQAAMRLEYAMLLASINQRGLSLEDYLRSGRHGIDPGSISTGLKGRAIDEFMAGNDGGYVATAVLTDFDPAEYNRRVSSATTHCLFTLSGRPQEDLAGLQELAAVLDDPARQCEWLLHGKGSFSTVEPLRQFCDALTSIKYGNGRSPRIRAIIDPLSDDVAASNATLGAFVEWPERPVILAGSSAQEWDGVRRTMGVGYRGLYVTADTGPVGLILRACLIRARQKLEPVAQWSIAFADDSFPQGEFQAIQHQLITLFQG